MTDEKSPYDDPEFKNYREDIKQAKSDRLEVFKIFSTLSLAICSGLIASIGYLIKEFKGYHSSWILLVAIMLTALALSLSLFELIFSQFATTVLENKLACDYYEDQEGSTKFRDKLNEYGKHCRALLFAIPILIFLAISSCILFVSLNLHSLQKGESVMGNDPKKDEVLTKLEITSDAGKPKPVMRHIASIITDSAGKPKQVNQQGQDSKGSGDPKTEQDKK
jgi:hypothetical protein